MMRTLSGRLLVRTLGAVAVILLAAAVLIYTMVYRSLLGELDAGLAAKAHALAVLTEPEDEGLEMEFAAGRMPEFGRAERPEYFELRDEAGTVVAMSPSLGESLGGEWPAPEEPGHDFSWTTLPDGRRGRAITLVFAVYPEHDVAEAAAMATLWLGRDVRDFDEHLARLRWLLFAVVLAAVLAGAGAMHAAVRQGLRPLRVLADRIGRLDVEDLGCRVELGETPGEMRMVVERLNDLLGRLEGAMLRERGFTADVAHELRTPLAGVVSALEVAGWRSRSSQEYEEVMRRCLVVSHQMNRLVNNLLMLARADAQQLTPQVEEVGLHSLIEECWRPFEARAKARGLRVRWEMDGEMGVRTDRELLGMVVVNLFDNATQYVDEGGAVEIAIEPSESEARVRVSNTGCTLGAGESEKVFGRFWRGDAARSDVGRHCGLGLALCQRVVSLLGGSIQAKVAEGVFTVRVVVPDGRGGQEFKSKKSK